MNVATMQWHHRTTTDFTITRELFPFRKSDMYNNVVILNIYAPRVLRPRKRTTTKQVIV